MSLSKMILGNWKMNKNYNEVVSFCQDFNRLIKKDRFLKQTSIVIGVAPTYVGIFPALSNLKPPVKVLAQNCNALTTGACTSEISYAMLQEIHVDMVLIGHSEVRAHLHESDQLINQKVLKLLAEQMTPVLCIGETLEEFNQQLTNQVISKQLKADLANVQVADLDRLVIAYEPIWAIGTGKTADTKTITNVLVEIKKILIDIFGDTNAHKIHLLYGGSANEKNTQEILAIKQVDGVLVGGASLDPQKFYTIIQSTPEYLAIQSVANKK